MSYNLERSADCKSPSITDLCRQARPGQASSAFREVAAFLGSWHIPRESERL